MSCVKTLALTTLIILGEKERCPGIFLKDVYSMFTFEPLQSPHLSLSKFPKTVLEALLAPETYVQGRDGLLQLA